MILIKKCCLLFLFLIGFTSFSQQNEISDKIETINFTKNNPAIEVVNQSNENREKYNFNTLINQDTTLVIQNNIIYPPTFKDYRRLGYDTGIYFGGAIVAFGVLYAMPESVTNWDKEDMKKNGIFNKWKQNVKAGPVWDHDGWVLNWVMHPFFGGIYYITARSSGFNVFESFLYSAFMSTFFWEFGIEAFAEIPSIQDLIITPVLGSVVGEGYFYAKKSILKHDKRILNSRFLGKTTLFIIDPFNSILDGCGYKERTKTQLNIAPVGFDQNSHKPVWGLNFNMQF